MGFTANAVKIKLHKRQIGDRKLHFAYKKQSLNDKQKVIICNLSTSTGVTCRKNILKYNFKNHLAEVHGIGMNLIPCRGLACKKKFSNNSRRKQHEDVCLNLKANLDALLTMSHTPKS